MADDNGWGDLFAKAAGTHEDVPKQQEVVSAKPKERSKKRKRQGANDAFLAARMHVPETSAWPAWSKLQESILSHATCSGWNNHDDKCKSCGTSPLYHRLCLEDSAVQKQPRDICWPLDMFCRIRNFRCVGVLVAMKDVQVHEIVQFVRIECGRLEQCMSEALDLKEEGQILSNKCRAVTDTAKSVIQDFNDKLFETAIRLMIACDDAYYRLYYLVISGIVSLCNHNDSLNMVHPAEYFHVPFLAWIGPEEALTQWNEFQTYIKSRHAKCDPQELRTIISDRYGLDPLLETDEQPHYTDALSYLHYNRSVETALLFFKSGWIHTKDAADQTKKALDAPIDNRETLSRHETPAPSILAEWRDSCRDRLCNLYAYATLSENAVQCIKDGLKDAGVSGIVEVGAGTGYLAALLQRAGIKVDAWDIHPSNGTKKHSVGVNEYHGLTPSFVKVQKGDSRGVFRQLPSLKENVALLLCYPPPESSMAKDALVAFLDNGGQCLIHIGEFGGLTGSRAFEDLLVRSFCCVERVPCLSWGTDAAEVTVWIRSDGERDGRKHQLLLPCSKCGEAEASKRCRLVRHVAYCSAECFRAHRPMLSTHLAINMIPLNADALNFNNASHFAPIRTVKRTAEDCLKGTSRTAKKAKTK